MALRKSLNAILVLISLFIFIFITANYLALRYFKERELANLMQIELALDSFLFSSAGSDWAIKEERLCKGNICLDESILEKIKMYAESFSAKIAIYKGEQIVIHSFSESDYRKLNQNFIEYIRKSISDKTSLEKYSFDKEKSFVVHAISLGNNKVGTIFLISDMSESKRHLTLINVYLSIILIISLIVVIALSYNQKKYQNKYISSVLNEQSKKFQDLLNSVSKICNILPQILEKSKSFSVSICDGIKKIEDLSKNLEKTTSSLNSIMQVTESAYGLASEGGKQMELVREAIRMLTESNRRLQEVSCLVNEIDKKTKIISEIASQTRLLSLNASIEAARAGEYGRGFTVVAEEVGNLATMSARASQEIEQILRSSRSEIESIVVDIRGKVNNSATSLEGLEKQITAVQNAIDSLRMNMDSVVSLFQRYQSDIHEVVSALKVSDDFTGFIEQYYRDISTFCDKFQSQFNSISLQK